MNNKIVMSSEGKWLYGIERSCWYLFTGVIYKKDYERIEMEKY